MKIIDHLKERELISGVINERNLLSRLERGKINLYCGFDPTSDSLHIGHLIPLMCLRRFQMFGHKPFVIIGGATGLIGDPSFRSKRRELNSKDTINEWKDKIERQILDLLDFETRKLRVVVLDNQSWLSKANVLDFLHNFGRYFRVKQLMSRNLNRSLLNSGRLTLPELVYPVLQGYDFVHLNRNLGVELQIGGSDQHVNIASGINMIRRLCQADAYGVTLQIAARSDGIKFGKTETDNVWLDPKKTNPYHFYQFWLNVDDLVVQKFVKFFTFVNLEELTDGRSGGDISHTSYVKSILAREVTKIVHGERWYRYAERVTAAFFGNKVGDLTEDDLIELSNDRMLISLRRDEIATLKHVLIRSGLVSSNRQADQMIKSGSITINGGKIRGEDLVLGDEHRIYGSFTIVCRGKKNHRLVRWSG